MASGKSEAVEAPVHILCSQVDGPGLQDVAKAALLICDAQIVYIQHSVQSRYSRYVATFHSKSLTGTELSTLETWKVLKTILE